MDARTSAHAFLADSGRYHTAKEIAENLGAKREDTNAALYDLARDGLVQRTAGVPPLWVVVSPALPSEAALDVVFIDLGNVHCCLAELLPYARLGRVQVRAYADHAYRGFGVAPSVENEPNVTLSRSAAQRRNAADSMVWDMALLAEEARARGRRLRFFVVTKDLGFRAVQELASEHGSHEVVFCQDWQNLRRYVE